MTIPPVWISASPPANFFFISRVQFNPTENNFGCGLFWGVLVLLKFYWAPDIMKFVLGRFSHFNIAIAYSNSTFCGAWTPSFCEFTQNISKTSTPLHRTRGVLVFVKFWHFSSELTKTWSSGARKYWTQKWISNLTFISFLLFVYISVFYNIVPILFTK